MNIKEIRTLMTQPLAEAKLYELLRQGLTNAAAIPEVETEPEQAAHHLLGCDNYMALIILYQTAEDARDEPDVVKILTDLADNHLRTLTRAVLQTRGPVGGGHKCEKGANPGLPGQA